MQLRSRWVWLSLVILVIGYWVYSSTRLSYAEYFQVRPDVYVGNVGFDSEFCLRVKASPEEIETFLFDQFTPEQRVPQKIDLDIFYCSAKFFPRKFENFSLGLEVDANGSIMNATRGAVNENGFFYYWNLSI